MSNASFYALICVCTAMAAVAAAPAGKELRIELSELLDKSVCPIRVEIDEDPNRIPRLIKNLKCAKTPNPLCLQENMTHACCSRHHHNYNTQCVEVVDHVLVAYRGADEPVPLPVSVGCSCMIRKGTPALPEP